jgi:hypothetical protein
MEGNPEMAPPPHLAQWAQEPFVRRYLSLIKLAHAFQFTSNHTYAPQASLEVRLLDEKGEVMKTVRIPDPKAPPAVRRQQALLARWLIEDQPVPPPAGESIPAEGKKVPEVPLWEPVPDEPRKLVLAWVPENLVPRDRPVYRPSEWSMLVVRSCARHLCRVHGAASAEVHRHSREPIPPRVLDEPNAPPEVEDLISTFRRLPR